MSNLASAWTGWYRVSGTAPWRFAVEADTLPDCSRRLTSFLRAEGIELRSNLDACLTRGGAPPDVPPRTPEG
jgi:hypothetical protein